jgi:ketosteroid isomerase-like protein
MARWILILWMSAVLLAGVPLALAQGSGAVDETEKEVNQVKDKVVVALEKLDAEGVRSYLHTDVVVVQPDGSTLKGAGAVADYLAKCNAGTGGWFKAVVLKPEIKTLAIHAGVVTVSGQAHDKYRLTNGTEMDLDCRFTATLEKADGKWVIRQLQAAPAGFENPMMTAVVTKSANAIVWAWFIGATMGAAVCGLIVRYFMRKRT